MKSQSKTNVNTPSPSEKKHLEEEKPLLAADLSGGFMVH